MLRLMKTEVVLKQTSHLVIAGGAGFNENRSCIEIKNFFMNIEADDV